MAPSTALPGGILEGHPGSHSKKKKQTQQFQRQTTNHNLRNAETGDSNHLIPTRQIKGLAKTSLNPFLFLLTYC